ncbi:hypothetical protein KFE25_001517 [Diacronema lutheri]|uniref:Uncharacterized protein n=2 Tax=Diacronema lutheri TaxID=2081491 RepID=A0A8J6C5K8_DIALT|nr:hypothetical protein KFE25_001517 [Diacronema lutheri]
MTALCPPEKLQDAYHIEAEGVCTQVCLPPALRKVAANHGVRYGMTCVGGTPLNRCTRFYLAGSRAGVRYFTFFCLEPCSASAQVCNGSTSEYNGLGHRGPARPRWAGDWWPGVPEDALETDELFCAARRAAVQPAAGAAAAPAGNGAPRGGPRLLESAPPALVREVHAVVPATAPLASAPAAHAAATVAAVKPAVADAGSLPPAAVFALAGPMRSSRQQRGRHHRSHEHRRRRLDHRV